jgi:hypothetical protein
LADDPKITILSLALPDGSPNGTGFLATGDQSLWFLYNGQIPILTSLDHIVSNPYGYASWTRDELENLIANVYVTVWPNRINIQDVTLPPNDPGGFRGTISGTAGYPDTPQVSDHSDHIIGANFAFKAVYEPQFATVKQWEMVAYEDYPNGENDAGFFGIGPDEYAQWDTYKWDAIATYAPYDTVMPCNSAQSCATNSPSTRQLYYGVQSEWIRGEWSNGLGF